MDGQRWPLGFIFFFIYWKYFLFPDAAFLGFLAEPCGH